MVMRRILMLVLVVGLLSLAGCGSKTAKVKGKITYDGKPVTSGQIAFLETNGKAAFGEIQPDGTYTLTTDGTIDGAYIGDYIVTITSTGSDEQPKPADVDVSEKKADAGVSEKKKGNGPPPIPLRRETVWLVPQIYSNTKTTTLKAKVENKNNEINFDLVKE